MSKFSSQNVCQQLQIQKRQRVGSTRLEDLSDDISESEASVSEAGLKR